jgi:hypothetical protein
MDLNHLVGGAVNGTILALIAIAVPRFTRHILAGVLVVAGLFYVLFAFEAHAGAPWLAAELVGVGIYGYAAVRGVRGSAWWLVAGWALHPLWDVALHHAGPGRVFAPEWYTTSCLTYDLMVAGVAAIAILIGTHVTDAPAATPTRARVAPLRPSTACCGCAPCTCAATGALAA